MTEGQPDRDTPWLRRAFALAREARAGGNSPFGAVLVDADGIVLGESINTVGTTGDVTGHAELNVVKTLRPAVDSARLAGSTMYASTEPCAMCAAGIYWSGIGRVVFGLRSTRLSDEIIGPRSDRAPLRLPCQDVLEFGDRHVMVIGPMLEDEAAAVHDGYWE
jgi:tRNA(Arg) A34 adenosine deaminase TadA